MFCHCYWLVSESTEWWGAGMVICLEQGADLHMAQLMPLPLTVSCFSKIYTGFTFLVVAYPGSPGKGPLNGCVCMIGQLNDVLAIQAVRLLCYFSLWTFVCLQVSCFSLYIPWCSHQQLYSYDTCGWNCHWLSSAFSSNSQRTCLASAVVSVRCWPLAGLRRLQWQHSNLWSWCSCHVVYKRGILCEAKWQRFVILHYNNNCRFLAIIQVNLHYLAPPVKNWRILLV